MIGPVVTLGFGPGASIALVTLLGFGVSNVVAGPYYFAEAGLYAAGACAGGTYAAGASEGGVYAAGASDGGLSTE